MYRPSLFTYLFKSIYFAVGEYLILVASLIGLSLVVFRMRHMHYNLLKISH